MLTVPGGYGTLEVISVDDARLQVTTELDTGADQIKVTTESANAGVTKRALITDEELIPEINQLTDG